jgi:hypothetical protein
MVEIMTKNERLQEVHTSLINGNRRQMVEQIDSNFIMYDFWQLYLDYLKEYYSCENDGIGRILSDFSDAVISYHRIKNK